MQKYLRILNLNKLLEHRSLFLLGPRQTGKSTFLAENYPQARFFSLLEADVFRNLSAKPELLRAWINESDQLIIIDEVQKLPVLLDEVQRLMELRPELRFILTGSSARKLKRGSANLLAGRAWICHMHPLVSPELNFERWDERLEKGSLPVVLNSPLAQEDLKAYVGTYLQEEIRAEGISRSIENFSRFLDVAGHTNGQLVNFTKVGNDAGVPPRTVREYFQVLEDTLLVHQLKPYQKTEKRKPVATSKYYFFDLGVTHQLIKRPKVLPGSSEYGQAFEHQLVLEIKAYLDYERIDLPLTFWRSQSHMEVDLMVGDHFAIEIKASASISNTDLKGLRALSEEVKLQRKILVCQEKFYRKTEDEIEIFPIQDFLKELWAGKIIEA